MHYQPSFPPCRALLAALDVVLQVFHSDSSEAQGHVATSASSANCGLQCQPPAATDTLSNPPYAINNLQRREHLGSKTLPVSARHLGGELEYDAHNLYGFSEAAATRLAVEQVTGKRAFVLSRLVGSEEKR